MDEEDAARQLDVDMERDVVTCEMPFGSVLFLNNIIPHRCAEVGFGQKGCPAHVCNVAV